MRTIQITPALALLLLSGKSLAQVCTGSTLTSGVNPQVTDYAAFEAEIARFTATATGADVPVYTNTVDLGATVVTAVGYAKSDALVAAGYTVTSAWATVEAPCVTSNDPTPTQHPDLPPSPVGSDCSAHGDHWHCKPISSVKTTAVLPPKPTGKNCQPHGDHWDCDDEEEDDHDDDEHDHDDDHATTTAVTPSEPSPPGGKNCTPHGDHWHCDDEDDSHSDDEEDSGSKTATVTPAVPSPTDGKNCEPHGDHWHCDGEDDDHSNDDEEGKQGGNGTIAAPAEDFDGSAAGLGSLSFTGLLAGVLGSVVAGLLL